MPESLPAKTQFNMDMWKAEDDRLNKQQKAMEKIRKLMYDQGSPLFQPLPGEEELPALKAANNQKLHMSLIQTLMQDGA
jgi:hypothetical protein